MAMTIKALLLVLLTFLVCVSGVCSHNGSAPASRVQLPGEADRLVLWRRSVAESVAPTIDPALPNASFILAERRTHRKDPLNDFKYYNGGWNISNKHYWASVGFTAAPLFLIGMAWFVGFGVVLLLIACYVCCCRRKSYSYSRTAYALSLILLVLFACAAIIGCILLYHAQAKAYKSWTGTLDYVVYQANATAENLRNFSSILNVAKNSVVDQVFLSASDQARINQIQSRINSSANDLTRRVDDNSDNIQDVLNAVRRVLIIVAAVMLLLAFLGLLFSILGLQPVVYILVIIGWILVAGTFILCGVFLLLHNATGDTCVALDEWANNPTSGTALDDVLPCVDVATANASLYQSKETTFTIVNLINQVITNVANGNFSPSLGPPFYFNQSGPSMPVLCNPFNADFSDRECKTGEVGFENATLVWKNYVCVVSTTGVCTTVGRITPAIHNQMASAVTVSYGLYHYTPFLISLEDCTFVRDTFNSITQNNCPGLRKYSEHIYFGLVMVSSGVMLSLVFWVIYARERRHRKYNKQLPS